MTDRQETGTPQVEYQYQGLWDDADACESCGADDVSTCAIFMREGRVLCLCEPCFKVALEDDMVHPGDPRVKAEE